MLGALFAVLSALSFAFSTITARRGVIGSSASFGLYITVILGVPLFAIAALATGQIFDTFDLPPEDMAMLAGAGVLHFLIGRYCNYRCIDAIGSNRSQPLQATNTIYSVVVAVIVLSEEVNSLMGVGIVLLVIGPMIMVERRRQRQAEPVAAQAAEQPAAAATPAAGTPRPNAATNPRYVEGYTFGLLSAAAYGTSPIMIRYALEDTGLGIAGGLIAYVAAAGLLIATLAIPGQLKNLRGFDLKVVPMFTASAVAVFLAQLFRFAALAIAPVSLVTPLARLGVVFVPTLSFIFNRNLESFSPRVLTGVALSGLGAVLLAIGVT